MNIWLLALYTAYPGLALLGYWGFLGAGGRQAAEDFGLIVFFVVWVAIVLIFFLTLCIPLG